MLAAGLLLGWLVVHTEIFYTDGLRYIAQARTIDQGSLVQGVASFGRPPDLSAGDRGDPSTDWAATILATGKGPRSLRRVFAGVLLVLPLYLISRRAVRRIQGLDSLPLYLPRSFQRARSGRCALRKARSCSSGRPGSGRACGCCGTARLLWLCRSLMASALAYLTRPEGLVILLSLLASLVVLAVLAVARISRPHRLGGPLGC